MSDAVLLGAATLVNEAGLHARPAVKLTQTAKRFAATLEFAVGDGDAWIDAKSPVKVMRAKAVRGTELRFRASGPDADAALAAVLELVRGGFGEA